MTIGDSAAIHYRHDMMLAHSAKTTLLFSLLLLLFIQTLTVWFESMYRIGLTHLSPGVEVFGLLFILSPLVMLLLPEHAQHDVLRVSAFVFLAARALLPLAGVSGGGLISGIGVGAFLVLLCLLLPRPFNFLQGNAGSALGLALMMSIALRAWGATYDISLARSGLVLSCAIVGLALALFVHLAWVTKAGTPSGRAASPSTSGPVIGLSASLTVCYLVLSSPGVVEAWLGCDNPEGPWLCVAGQSVAIFLLMRGVRVPRAALGLWNLAYAIFLVGGLLALRVDFPKTPLDSAVEVRPKNMIARILLDLMFLLSPVVVCNVQAACRSLREVAAARRLAVPLVGGAALLVLLTMISIFSNVWGYVGPLSAIFRNQFHVPFLLAASLMLLASLSPDASSVDEVPKAFPSGKLFAGLTAVVAVCALVGLWRYRPVSATAAARSPKQLTVLSYNLQQGSALDGNRNWENQLSIIKAIDADVIGLQESDTPRPSSGNVSAAKYFGAKLGYHIYYGPNTVSGTYGTAILSRFPLKNTRTIFTFSNQDEVGTAAAEFEMDGKTFAFFNSHPSGTVPRMCHAQELVRQLRPYAYVIAVGDYNTTPQEEAYQILVAHVKDSWAERHPGGVGSLHPQIRPRAAIRPHGSSGLISNSGDTITMPDRIDHIFVSERLKVIDSFYLPAPESQTDHPAHWAVLTWD